MFIDRVAQRLLAAPELAKLLDELGAGRDATLAVAQSARPLCVAALWTHDPRPCVVIVSGEEAADRTAHALAAWLGPGVVCRYPERRDLPWAEVAADDAVIGARCRAIERLATGEACVVVASARSLMRRVPPPGSGYYASSTFAIADEVPFEDMGALLVGMGYNDDPDVSGPGAFHIHGDTVDVFPAQASSPVRLEFFGDEIDRIRRMVPSTGQTIGELEEVSIIPARELALTDETIHRARRALWNDAQESTAIAADLELIEARSASPVIDRYLPQLYGSTSSPLAHASSRTLVVLAEPRALIDDCTRSHDEVTAAAAAARASLDGLYASPRDMDFGSTQQLSLS
ncbi:MAG: transcription-repair coupling factor, partial [Atopobiaceae bacterium]|nr:transcription-repair coupling factor [Atopobiaceae bacterium]